MKNKKTILLVISTIILLIILLLLFKSKNNTIEKQLSNNNFISSKDEYGYVEKNLYTKDIGDITIITFYDNIEKNINSKYSSISIDINSFIISGKYIEYKDNFTYYFLPIYSDGKYSFTYEVISNGNSIFFEGKKNNDEFFCDTEENISDENKTYICNNVENMLNTFEYDINKEIFEKNILHNPSKIKGHSKFKIFSFIILIIISTITYMLYKKGNNNRI